MVTPHYAGELLAATTHLSVIWRVALSVLGINVAKRSQEKRIAAGQPPEPGLLDRLLALLTGWKGLGHRGILVLPTRRTRLS